MKYQIVCSHCGELFWKHVVDLKPIYAWIKCPFKHNDSRCYEPMRCSYCPVEAEPVMHIAQCSNCYKWSEVHV